jgi:hypothetical protein
MLLLSGANCPEVGPGIDAFVIKSRILKFCKTCTFSLDDILFDFFRSFSNLRLPNKVQEKEQNILSERFLTCFLHAVASLPPQNHRRPQPPRHHLQNYFSRWSHPPYPSAAQER